jgi:hypothetical protein
MFSIGVAQVSLGCRSDGVLGTTQRQTAARRPAQGSVQGQMSGDLAKTARLVADTSTANALAIEAMHRHVLRLLARKKRVARSRCVRAGRTPRITGRARRRSSSLLMTLSEMSAGAETPSPTLYGPPSAAGRSNSAVFSPRDSYAKRRAKRLASLHISHLLHLCYRPINTCFGPARWDLAPRDSLQ